MTKTNRREFLKSSALAGAAVAAGTVLGGQRAQAQDKQKDEAVYWTADLGKARDLNEKHPVLDPNPGQLEPGVLIRRATDVSERERRRMFWVADFEQASAWLALHDVHGGGADLLSSAKSGGE